MEKIAKTKNLISEKKINIYKIFKNLKKDIFLKLL